MLGIKVVPPGYARGERLARRIRTILFAVLALCALGCGGLLSLVISVVSAQNPGSVYHPTKPLWMGGLIALAFVLAAVTSYVYEKD
jgi:uncharacterized membrane protein YdcZ (DUF606 family)